MVMMVVMLVAAQHGRANCQYGSRIVSLPISGQDQQRGRLPAPFNTLFTTGYLNEATYLTPSREQC